MKTIVAVALLTFAVTVQAQELLPPLKVGQTGYLQRTSEGRKVKVRKVIDDTSLSATVFFWATPDNKISDTRIEVILKGISTREAVDNEFFDVPQLLVVGREKTKTGRTLFTLEPAKK